MKQKPKKTGKNQILKKQNLLYHKAEEITDYLFQTNYFFDPHDLLQVKYEMLRRVQKDGWPVTKASSVFGFSRLSFYKILSAFESSGITGLLPKKKGPKKPNKITDAVLSFIRDTQNKEPETKASKLKILIKAKFGIDLHKRTIERIYKNKKKQAQDRRNDA
jgi:transposase